MMDYDCLSPTEKDKQYSHFCANPKDARRAGGMNMEDIAQKLIEFYTQRGQGQCIRKKILKDASCGKTASRDNLKNFRRQPLQDELVKVCEIDKPCHDTSASCGVETSCGMLSSPCAKPASGCHDTPASCGLGTSCGMPSTPSVSGCRSLSHAMLIKEADQIVVYHKCSEMYTREPSNSVSCGEEHRQTPTGNIQFIAPYFVPSADASFDHNKFEAELKAYMKKTNMNKAYIMQRQRDKDLYAVLK